MKRYNGLPVWYSHSEDVSGAGSGCSNRPDIIVGLMQSGHSLIGWSRHCFFLSPLSFVHPSCMGPYKSHSFLRAPKLPVEADGLG